MTTTNQANQSLEVFSKEQSGPSINLSGMPGNVTVSVETGEAAVTTIFTPRPTLEAATLDESELITKTRAEYVKEFKYGVEKTARSTLEMCRVVYEANRTLDGPEFADFCKDIGFRDTSSSIRKFSAIGKLYPRFIKYADQLPAGWTNIYLITQIPVEEFEGAIAAGLPLNKISNATMKAMLRKTRDLNSFTKSLPYSKKDSGFAFGKLLFTKDPSDQEWLEIQQALSSLKDRLPFKVVIDERIDEIISDRRIQVSKARSTVPYKYVKPEEVTTATV